MTAVIDLSLLQSQALLPILMKAFVVGLLTSVCASVLGVPLVLKRYSMIGDGLSHMGFLAVAIATVLGVSDENQMFVTLPLVTVAAVILLLLSESGKIKGDAAVAILTTGSVAAGYMIYSIANSGAGDVCSSLFGSSILALKGSDVTFSVLLAFGVLFTFVLLYNKIFAVTFDAPFASAAGSNTVFYNIILAVLTAVTIVVGMKMIGSIMISALIVFPALAAMRLCKKFKSVILCAASIAGGCFLVGMLFATVVRFETATTSFSLPIGPCVATCNMLALLLATAISKISKRR